MTSKKKYLLCISHSLSLSRPTMSSSSTPPSEPANVLDEKAPPQPEHVERIATFERVPGHTNYHEKNGLRTYGDDMDHDHEPPVRAPIRAWSFDYLVIWRAKVN